MATVRYEYFVIINEVESGPYSADDLVALDTTTQSSLVWREGLDTWIVITSLPEFSDVGFPSESVPPAAEEATSGASTVTSAGTTSAVGATTSTVEGSTTFTTDIKNVGGTTTSTKDLTYNGGLWLGQSGVIQNHKVSGFTATTSTLTLTIGAGTAYVGGRRVTTTGSTALTLTNNTSQDVYILQNGSIELVADGASPSTTDSFKIYDTTTLSGAITVTTITTVIAPVGASLVDDSAITTAKISNLAITNAKLADSSVTENKLAVVDGLVPGSYTTPNITVNSRGIITSLVDRNLSTRDLSDWSDAKSYIDGFAWYDSLSGTYRARSEEELVNSMKSNQSFGTKIKYKTLSYQDFVDTAETDADATLTSIMSLPKGSVIQTIKVKHSEATTASTGTVTNANLKIQYTGAVDLTANWDTAATVASTTHQVTTDFTSAATMPHDIDILIDAELTIVGGATINNLNDGSIGVWVVYFSLHEENGYPG